MTTSALLTALRQRDVRLTVTGERLWVDAPTSALSDELRTAVREQKRALVALLAGEEEHSLSPALEVLVERVGTMMLYWQRHAGKWSDAEFRRRRDQVLVAMNEMDAELAGQGQQVSNYGWSVTLVGEWYRLE